MFDLLCVHVEPFFYSFIVLSYTNSTTVVCLALVNRIYCIYS